LICALPEIFLGRNSCVKYRNRVDKVSAKYFNELLGKEKKEKARN
jgi:hypothetical protein